MRPGRGEKVKVSTTVSDPYRFVRLWNSIWATVAP
jgi:hypothetical protein